MKRGGSIWVSILALLVLTIAVGVAACGGETDATGTTGTPGTAKPSSTTVANTETSSPGTTGGGSGSALTGPYVEPPYLDSQPVDLTAIANLGDAPLTDAQKQVLARQSFVAAVQDPINGPYKFWHVYETARYQGLPVLVTTDSLLNAYHGLFDTLLQRMEEVALYDQCVAMTDALYADASLQWNTATDATVKEDARLNMAFFAVAGSLLKGGLAAPDVVADEVQAELDLIEAAGGPSTSPILGYTEDYSQYKPRGHYTRSERLQQYFKAMMWYGHTAFYINPRNPDVPEELANSLTRRAVLVASSLSGPAKQAWAAIYDPTSFLVGRSDDLTVDDMNLVLTKLFNTTQPAPDDLASADVIAEIRAELNKLAAPKIESAAVPNSTPGDETREENQRSFRVMGQRYIPDSYAFQQLVWEKVGDKDNKRESPMGLDVMTVLGSDQAYSIAKKDFGQDQFKNWEEQIKKVNDEFNSKSADIWPANLYTGWLESLQLAMAFPGDTAPAFMKSKVWARKSLNAALGSWTELRHDTILYAKQSIVAEGDGGEEPLSAGYVEPYPAFYTKIADLAATLRRSMDDYHLVDEQSATKLDGMIELARTLATIAQKELDGQELTQDEKGTIIWYGSTLEGLETWYTDEEPGMTLAPAAEKSPLVADVHTNFNGNAVLEEATGYPLVLYVAFELDGKLQLMCGASYAYYEFTSPLEKRLTDEEWTTMLDERQAPPRPAWTNEWIVE